MNYKFYYPALLNDVINGAVLSNPEIVLFIEGNFRIVYCPHHNGIVACDVFVLQEYIQFSEDAKDEALNMWLCFADDGETADIYTCLETAKSVLRRAQEERRS